MDYAATLPQVRPEKIHPRWTLKRFVTWLQEKFKMNCGRETVRRVLKALGLSWKQARK
jgi:transposase